MSANLITINNATLEQLTYRECPVVTVQMIADVHGIAADNVQKSFQRHAKRFIEGKHYFRLDFTEANKLGLSVQVSRNGLTLFTEKGYLLLTKPLRDNTAWEVQERMVDEYFALKAVAAVATPWDIMAQLVETGRQQEQRLLALEAQQRADMEARLATQQQTIEALHQAAQANAKADQALDTQQFFTLAEYVYLHDLQRQLPEQGYKEAGLFLTDYCVRRGIPVRKIPVAGKRWEEEHGYHIGTLHQALPGYMARRFAQTELTVIPGGA